MGDVHSTQCLDEPINVIACGQADDERRFTVKRRILYPSPVLRGYMDEPDTIPPGVARNGPETLTLNNDGEVVKVMLDYLKSDEKDDPFSLPASEAVFLIRLYKLALSLGLDNLCTLTLHSLDSQTRKVGEFGMAAIEASQCGLINEERFRKWFTTYVGQRHEDLLGNLPGDDPTIKFCRILVTALALSKDTAIPKDGFTPPNSARKRREDSKLGTQKAPTPKKTYPTPSRPKETPTSSSKKRKYQATAEEAPESD